MKRTLLAVGITCCMLLPGAAWAKDPRIGVVNMKRAVSETREGKEANERLTKLKDKLEAELNRKLKEFYAEQAQLQKAMAILKEDEKRKKMAESQQKFQELQKRYLAAEKELMTKQTKELMKIQSKLSVIIEKIAAKEKYDYIFANEAVLWAPRHVDLTNEVIRLYNDNKK